MRLLRLRQDHEPIPHQAWVEQWLASKLSAR